MARPSSRQLPAGNAKTKSSTQGAYVPDVSFGVDPMNTEICTVKAQPVVVIATHEELVRSARDIWGVTVSLLTELTPDKFATAPWAAALFTAELPFHLAKLWHIQHALITSANSYMQTESMLTTFIETIDIPKLLKELTPWVLNLKGAINLPLGWLAHVPAVEVSYPSDIQIIKQRFDETNCTNQPLVRHEAYFLMQGRSEHWFYLPKTHDWSALNQANHPNHGLAEFIKTNTQLDDQIHFVFEQDGELIHPVANNSNISGKTQIFSLAV